MRELGDRRHVDVWIILSVIIHRALNTGLELHCARCVSPCVYVWQSFRVKAEDILQICSMAEVQLMHLEEFKRRILVFCVYAENNCFEENGLTLTFCHVY